MTEWTIQSGPSETSTNNWIGLTCGKYNDELIYVAVSSNNVPNTFMTSLDAITWTVRSVSEENNIGNWSAIAYGTPGGNGLFVALSANKGATNLLTSPDGINWTKRNIPAGTSDNIWWSIVYGNGKFVAISYEGANTVMYSSDGITWQLPTSTGNLYPKSTWWWNITYANNLFVVVTQGQTMTSTDGNDWVYNNISLDQSWTSVTYGLVNETGLYVAVAEWTTHYTNNQIMTSPDGTTWTQQYTPVGTNKIAFISIAYGNGLFVAVGTDVNQGTESSKIITSSDGVNWALDTTAPTSYSWNYIIYKDGNFIVVGKNNIIMIGYTVPEPTGITTTSTDTTIAINWSFTNNAYWTVTDASHDIYVTTDVNNITLFNLAPNTYYALDITAYIGDFMSKPKHVTIATTCFLAGSVVFTDQGDVNIEDLVPNQHTINGLQITSISKTISPEKQIVCFEKNCFELNIPNKTTYSSLNHLITYKTKCMTANLWTINHKNINKNININKSSIYKVPYNGETMYNVVLSKYIKNMKVNNMDAETLNHTHSLASHI